MRRPIITATLVLGLTLLATGGAPVQAGSKASPPQSSAFGKTLPEWMQLYMNWLVNDGDSNNAHVGRVQFLPLPSGVDAGGSGTYNDPDVFVGHLEVCLPPGSPFVLPVVAWFDSTGGLILPADLFTDPNNAQTTVYVDGKPVMDSTQASVSPFYFGIVYPDPTFFAQGVGFVHPPLSVGTHTIKLDSELLVPPDVYVYDPVSGLGVEFHNTWTLNVAPTCPPTP